tara:strand:+ start:168 stop:926 length:759 start_codon:yes stop_codon:yes gene_type:complete
MHQELNYNQSIINTNINKINLNKIRNFKENILVLGGSSGYGKSIFKFLKRKGIVVFKAGLSKSNDLEIDLRKKSFAKKLRRFCQKKDINILIISAATDFLDFSDPDIFNKDYQKNLYMNSFFLMDFVKEINNYKNNINSIIVFTAEGAWSGFPFSHINYNLSKTILNSIVFHISEAKLVNCICAIDPGEAKTKMNKYSKENPNKCIPMIIKLIVAMKKIPHEISGSFFHIDGRHLSFLKKAPYKKILEFQNK